MLSRLLQTKKSMLYVSIRLLKTFTTLQKPLPKFTKLIPIILKVSFLPIFQISPKFSAIHDTVHSGVIAQSCVVDYEGENIFFVEGETRNIQVVSTNPVSWNFIFQNFKHEHRITMRWKLLSSLRVTIELTFKMLQLTPLDEDFTGRILQWLRARAKMNRQTLTELTVKQLWVDFTGLKDSDFRYF